MLGKSAAKFFGGTSHDVPDQTILVVTAVGRICPHGFVADDEHQDFSGSNFQAVAKKKYATSATVTNLLIL